MKIISVLINIFPLNLGHLPVSNRMSARIRPNGKSKNGYRLACFYAETRFDLGNTARILV